MGDWLTEAELEDRFDADRIDQLADRDGDGNPDAGVIEGRIADAEGRVRSELRGRFSESDLPTVPGDASETLKRLVAKLAYYYLHDRYDAVSDAVIRHRDDALAELRAIRSGELSLLLAGEPAVDRGRPVVATRKRSSSLTDQAITLDAMEGWGR